MAKALPEGKLKFNICNYFENYYSISDKIAFNYLNHFITMIYLSIVTSTDLFT